MQIATLVIGSFSAVAIWLLITLVPKLSGKTATHNMNVCAQIESGITIEELNAKFLGEKRRMERSGKILLYFETPFYCSYPIRARVDEKNNKVLALYCGGKDRPNWELKFPHPDSLH